jgi:hypothetical protein
MCVLINGKPLPRLPEDSREPVHSPDSNKEVLNAFIFFLNMDKYCTTSNTRVLFVEV